VIPYCIRQALDNGTIVIHGDGKQTRDYVFIDDVVDAMVSAATVLDINRMIINVGSGKDTSVNDLVNQVIEITGAKPEIVMNKTHDSGPSRMCADLGIARKKLGYKPKVNLKEGLSRIIEEDPQFNKVS
jgi:UDP-glucose 4-epimerase